MGTLRIGCAGFLGARDEYWKKVDMVELAETQHGFPRPGRMKTIRSQAGPDAAVIVVANQIVTHPPGDPALRLAGNKRPDGPFGFLQDTPAVNDAWARTVKAATAVAADGILLRTPPSFTPSAVHRKALEDFVAMARPTLPEGCFLAWEPTGLWEADVARDIAGELGLVVAGDPLMDDPPVGPVAYFRMRGLVGARLRYSDDDLLDLLEKAQGFDTTYIVFDHSDRLRDARRTIRIAKEEGLLDG